MLKFTGIKKINSTNILNIKLSSYHKIFYNEWQLEPSSSRYNIVFDQTIDNTLDIPRLKNAVERLITDQLLLNSHIGMIDDELYWITNSTIRPLDVFDDIATHDRIYEYVSQPFKIMDEPLYRLAIFNQADGNYRFVLVFHHLVMGGSSGDDLVHLISEYYNDDKYQAKLSLESQYNYLVETTISLETQLKENIEENEKFWANALTNIEAVDLTFLKRTVHKSINGSTTNKNPICELRFAFTDNELVKLSHIVRKYAITPYMYSQCIFALLIYQYTRQIKFGFCYPISIIKEYSALLYGVAVNTNIYSCNLMPNNSILDLFTQNKLNTKKLTNKENNYQYFPISKILMGKDNKNILDVFFSQTKFRDKKFNFTNVSVVSINSEFEIDLNPILLFEQDYQKSNNLFKFIVRYNITNVDEVILKQFVSHYQKLFIDVLSDLEQGHTNKPISEYSPLTIEEYNKIIYDWNKTAKPYSKDKTIHQLFEEQVLKTPDNIAVVYEDTKLTYKELNHQANQLAHYIKNKYLIQANDLVALCLERDQYMLIAILAVLKSGGAYVPIDHACPINRIKYILDDTNTKVLLINTKTLEKISAINNKDNHNFKSDDFVDYNILAIDHQELQAKLVHEFNTNLNINMVSSNLAYVVYTSGTTGNPKGAMIEHRNVINYVTYLTTDNQISDVSVGSQYAGFGFDATVIEIFPIILSGGKLCIIPEKYKLEPSKINSFYNNYGVEYSFLPPVMAQLIFEFKNTTLKNLIVGGDKFSTYTGQNYRVINAYGPTETTVQSNGFVVNEFYKNMPIGKPINNVTNYILDANLNPLPIGAIGELHIGGDGVSRGYLNNDKLTTEKFVNNPFRSQEDIQYNRNSVLYKTGDLCRYLPDGNVEYIGRNDSQIKIRGHRIEPEDIEANLCAYPGIKQAIVLALEIKQEHSFNNNSSDIELQHHNENPCNKVTDVNPNEPANLSNNSNLLPIQQWFFNQNFANINHWNQSFLIRVPKLNKELLLHSFIQLVNSHDCFKFRYNRSSDKTNDWHVSSCIDNLSDSNSIDNKLFIDPQHIELDRLNFQELDVTKIPHKEGTPEFNDHISQVLTSWQSNFDIENGPLHSFGYIYGYDDGSSRIYCALHHLIVDVVSWHIILHDLQKIYTDLSNQQNYITYKQKNTFNLLNEGHTSYSQWIEVVKSYALTNTKEKDYWTNMLSGHTEFDTKLSALCAPINVKDSKAKFSLNCEDTNKLINNSRMLFDSKVNEFLLSVLAITVKELLASNTIYLTLESHGRELIDSTVDTSHTIGWFTTMFPVKLDVTNNNLIDVLKSTKNTLRNIPNNGIGYGTLFGYAKNLPLISFNYLGQIDRNESDNFWRITEEYSGQNISSENNLYNVVDVVGYVINKQLIFTINSRFSQDQLNQFTEMFKLKLLSSIEAANQNENYTNNQNIPNNNEHLGKVENFNNQDQLAHNSLPGEQSTISNNTSSKYLTAYYVSDTKLDQDAIINHLSARLPQYSIPQVFVWLEKLPLTLNGKVNIKALPDPQLVDNSTYTAPRDEKEYLICQAFAKVLYKDKIGIYDDFFKSGGDSISAITLIMSLQNNFHVNVRDIYTYPTPLKLAQNIAYSNNSIKNKLFTILQENIHKDVVKPQDEILRKTLQNYTNETKIIKPNLATKSIKNVLLTGATGYLGCNILHQLLTYTTYNIYLFVRAQSDQVATERIDHKCKLYFGESLYNNPRVFVLAASIEEADFGISQEQYAHLVRNIDSIIHVAALVKQFGNADVFYKANVQATINLLEFAKLTNLKDFHYLSTSSVLKYPNESDHQWHNYYTEEALPNKLQFSENNIYLKTKLEAETEVVKYRNYGINTNIYRVGNLTFMLKDLSVQENVDTVVLNYWLRYLFQSKKIFENSNLNISPVDLTADAVVKLFDKRCSTNEIYHVFNPYSFNLDNYVKSHAELSVKILPMADFITSVMNELENNQASDVMMQFLFTNGWLGTDGMYQFSKRIYLQNKTQHILECLNFSWPHITNEQFREYLKKIFK